MPSKILITGATGFTGGHLARRLASQGQPVRALVRDLERAESLQRAGVELALGDLRDTDSLAEATRGIELVYHIAALFRPENVTRQDMWAVNVEGTRHLLNASIQAGVQRFVHCSTIGVHGDVENPPATEKTPYNPGDYYQESKTEGEKLALEYMKAGKLPIVVFRPGGIYGPGDTRFLKLFKAIKNRRFIMFGSGEVLYQLVHIDDLIDGIVLCGTKENAVDQTYILTGEEPLTLNQLVAQIATVVNAPLPKWHLPVAPLYYAGFACEILCKPLGINPPLYRRRVDFFKKDRAFTIAKAQNELGFQPKVSLPAGLEETASWYSQQGLL